MPLNIPAGMGVAAIQLRVVGDPQPMICTLGVSPTAPAPMSDQHALRVKEAFRVTFLSLLSNQYSLVGVTIRERTADGGDAVWTSIQGTTALGGGTGGPCPQQVGVLVEKLTNRAGRRGVGRMFVPGIQEVSVNGDGSILASDLTIWQTTANNFLERLTTWSGAPAGSGEPVVPQLFHGNSTSTQVSEPQPGTRVVTKTTGAAGPGPNTITAFRIDPVVGTQRRRLR